MKSKTQVFCVACNLETFLLSLIFIYSKGKITSRGPNPPLLRSCHPTIIGVVDVVSMAKDAARMHRSSEFIN